MVHTPLRTDFDGADRPCHRHHRHTHVSADIPACRKHSMNVSDLAGITEPLSHDVIAGAREQAQRSGARVIDVLDEQLGLAPAEFVSAVATTFRYSALVHHELAALTPVFDAL